MSTHESFKGQGGLERREEVEGEREGGMDEEMECWLQQQSPGSSG